MPVEKHADVLEEKTASILELRNSCFMVILNTQAQNLDHHHCGNTRQMLTLDKFRVHSLYMYRKLTII